MKTYEYWLKYYENATKEQVIEDSMHDIEEITKLQQENKQLKSILTELETWVKWHYDFWILEEINHGECFSAIKEEIRELKIKYGLIQKDKVLENQINALIEAQDLIDKGDKENENNNN